MTASDALSPKHRLFLDEYRKDRNGAAAAKRAGYSAKRANVTAAELLARDDVKAALAEVDTGNRVAAELTEQRIIDELSVIAFADIGKVVEDWPAPIVNVKRAALVDLGKHLGMFKDRVEHTGKDGGPIEVAASPLDQARRVAFLLAKAAKAPTPKT